MGYRIRREDYLIGLVFENNSVFSRKHRNLGAELKMSEKTGIELELR